MSSVFTELLKAVEATVSAAVTMGPEQIRVRRRLAFRKGQDTLPFLVIAPDAERVADYTMPNGVHMDYSINFALITESSLILEPPYWLLDRREEIRKALHVTTFDAVPEIFDVVSYEPSAPYPDGAFDQAFDVSVQRFTWRSRETRTNV